MLALMPRASGCVLCGQTLPGRGRIDRIYCSASCRTLAWRARTGDRYEGRRKRRVPAQPGDYVARKALPLLAVRMKTELDAAKQRIAELEQALGEQREPAPNDNETIAGVAAAVGVAALFAATRTRLSRRHRGELDRIRTAVEKEREHHRAEMAAEREQASRRETDHGQQVEALRVRVERAEQDERAAATSATQAHAIADALRSKLDEAGNEIWRQIFELAKFRTENQQVRAANAHLEETLTTERQNFSIRSGRLFDCIEERDAKISDLQQAHSELERQAGAEQQRLTEANQSLQKQLAQRETRLERNQALAPQAARREHAESLALKAATDGNTDGRSSTKQLDASSPPVFRQQALSPPAATAVSHQTDAPRKVREQNTSDDQSRSKSVLKRRKKTKKEPSPIKDSIAAAGRAVAGAVAGLMLGQGASDSGNKRLNPKRENRRLGAGSKK